MTTTAHRIALASAAIILAWIAVPVRQRLTTLGLLRGHIENIHGVEPLRTIAGTTMCEDLHLEPTTGRLFAACQDAPSQRARWFPPNLDLIDPESLDGGCIVRIDPVSMSATTLRLRDFRGPMVTHGIDILNDPDDANLLFIYVVSHLPNPERWGARGNRNAPPERPRIEIFTHRLDSDEAVYVRSVEHAAIRMPNDIVAIAPYSFYVTNDHVRHEGPLRFWEDLGTQGFSPIPDTVLVDVLDPTSQEPSAGVQVARALKSVHNNNGLGRGNPCEENEIIILDATGGVVNRGIRNILPGDRNITVMERVQMDSTLDNPSYYHDRFSTRDSNASGYILPGLGHGYRMMTDFPYNERPIPSLVWHLRPRKDGGWEKKLLFQDDGNTLRSASGAVLIGIDPLQNSGKKQGWLFVTGFASFNMVAAKVDLS